MSKNTIKRAAVNKAFFNEQAHLPFQLRLDDFALAMRDVYDFFFDVNTLLLDRGLHRFDDMMRPAAMSGMISDMLTASMAKHSRSLVENRHFNGHPDLIVQGRYKNNSVIPNRRSRDQEHRKEGRRRRHARRARPMDVRLRLRDRPRNGAAAERESMRFVEVYLAAVLEADFRKNPRGELGTRTATLDRDGIQKLRKNWIYKVPAVAKVAEPKTPKLKGKVKADP